jgi:hypothetical protein
MNMTEIKAGGRYLLTTRMKHRHTGEDTTETFETRIHCIEQRDGYLYIGHIPKDQRQGEWGFFRWYEEKNRPHYGIVRMEAVA